MVGDRALAEDVTQEAFTSAWRSSYAYRPERGSVRAWVLGITHRRAIDALRHRSAQARLKAREEGFAERVVESAPTEMLALRRWDARRVRRAVETLPNDQRRAIELAYFAGLAHTEIAATLDLPLGTVKSRMRLGLEKLRRAIDPSEIVA